MDNKAAAEPEPKDVTVPGEPNKGESKGVDPERAGATASPGVNISESKGIDPIVTITERVDQLERIVQAIERHDKRDRSQFWVAVLLALVAIILSIVAIVR